MGNEGQGLDSVTLFIIYLAVIAVFFLLIRTAVLWYYKINERIELQREQNVLLRKVLLHLGDDLTDVFYTDESHEQKGKIADVITDADLYKKIRDVKLYK